ncbi:CHAP domain-containing protein [Kribbella deserti]|uniref:CHAP domain-containing protein n=1 Tax=Kribbella deserti TaxID=1926257 RepID=A0ABV6QTY9_9ACTN
MIRVLAISLVGLGLVGALLSPVAIATLPSSVCADVKLSGPLDAEQRSNAAVIVGVATRRGMGEAGAVIGVMTALTESSLRNLEYGDAAGPDSRGLFQQRDGLGPLATRMSPAGAAGLFFDALTTVAGWQAMPPWQAAQAVQRSAFSDGSNYRRNHDLARGIVSTTDLTAGGCSDRWLPTSDRALPGADQAIARARALVGSRGYYQLCARLAANIWGRPRSGYYSAATQWQHMQAIGQAHPGDRNPPAGALLFWDTGGPYGHVAVYIGKGHIVSNDIHDQHPGQGGVYLAELETIEGTWAATYQGWSPPIYRN